MREIKFRGKATYDGRWVYGLLRRREGLNHDIIETIQGVGSDVDPETVGECTGLHDKNGKEIYEGDILMPGLREVMWCEDGAFEHGVGFYTVTHEKGAFSNYVKFSLGKTQTKNAKVIGNIYSNPELLERKDK